MNPLHIPVIDLARERAGVNEERETSAMLHGSDASVVTVKQRSHSGVRWTETYPFAHLHQPSSFYDANFTALGKGSADALG